jgi:hypothetical protein
MKPAGSKKRAYEKMGYLPITNVKNTVATQAVTAIHTNKSETFCISADSFLLSCKKALIIIPITISITTIRSGVT